MSDKPYMTHDLGARNDPKLVAAERASRGLYKAIWWDLTEMIWENGGYLQMDFDNLAYILRYPSPEEVRAVVLDFDLFLNDGERFWNNSALERIQHKEDVSAQKANAGRQRAVKQREQAEANADAQSTCSTDAERMLNGCSTDAERMLNNKSINKLINKKNNLSARGRAREDEEREREIFEIFFFRNFADPVGELDRFRDFYYKDGSWKNSNGREITDIKRTAMEWRPEKDAPRFAAQFIAWYQDVYAEAKANDGPWFKMIEDLEKVYVKGPRNFTLVFGHLEVREAVAEFIDAHGLYADLTLNYATPKRG